MFMLHDQVHAACPYPCSRYQYLPDAKLHVLSVHEPVSEAVVLLRPLGPRGVGQRGREPVGLGLQDLGLEGAAAHTVGANQHQGLALEGRQLHHLFVQTQLRSARRIL